MSPTSKSCELVVNLEIPKSEIFTWAIRKACNWLIGSQRNPGTKPHQTQNSVWKPKIWKPSKRIIILYLRLLTTKTASLMYCLDSSQRPRGFCAASSPAWYLATAKWAKYFLASDRDAPHCGYGHKTWFQPTSKGFDDEPTITKKTQMIPVIHQTGGSYPNWIRELFESWLGPMMQITQKIYTHR